MPSSTSRSTYKTGAQLKNSLHRNNVVMRCCRCQIFFPKGFGFGTIGIMIILFQNGGFRWFFSFEVTYPMLTQMQHTGHSPAGVKTPAKIQNSIYFKLKERLRYFAKLSEQVTGVIRLRDRKEIFTYNKTNSFRLH